MPVNTPHGDHPPTHGDPRRTLLTHLLTAIRARGGTALLALASTSHPVLYVRHHGRTVPVVVVQAVTGGRWFIWGRTAYADVSQVEAAAERLADPPPSPVEPETETGRPWYRPAVPQARRANLVTERRTGLKAASLKPAGSLRATGWKAVAV